MVTLEGMTLSYTLGAGDVISNMSSLSVCGGEMKVLSVRETRELQTDDTLKPRRTLTTRSLESSHSWQRALMSFSVS